MFLKTFRLKNFKAIRDSGVVTFTPLTALIGYNGSGKSSLIEGLQTYQHIVTQGLDEAMHRWRGFEYIHNPPGLNNDGFMSFSLSGETYLESSYSTDMVITSAKGALAITREEIAFGNVIYLQRDKHGAIYLPQFPNIYSHLRTGVSALSPVVVMSSFGVAKTAFDVGLNPREVEAVSNEISVWQFADFNAYQMGNPLPQARTQAEIVLAPDGSNIAQYLLDIRDRDEAVFMGILEALRQVLPYADDLQPTLTTELERSVYLQLTEGKAVIPGWLLSTGTLRIVALLALFRHPNPQPLIVIDEIENGLDPRTLNFLVEEMRNMVESGASQIILTTHSPYLLDLLSLSQIVLVERTQSGETVFTRPADDESLREWSTRFAPGMLYTSGRLSTLA